MPPGATRLRVATEVAPGVDAEYHRMMRCPVMVGRDALVASLSSPDATGVHMVAGEAGIGKSRLILESTRVLSESGVVVLTGRATPTDRSRLRPVVEAVIDGVRLLGVPSGEALDPYLPVLGTLVPELAGGRPAETSAPIVAEAVLRLLTGWSLRLVVVLEDLHWADRETLTVVEYLVDHLFGDALVLATVRTGESPDADRVVDGLEVRSERVHRLDPLDPGEISEVVTACLGRADPERTQWMVENSGGLPLVIEDMLDDRHDRWRYSGVIRDRLDRLDPDGRIAVHAAAVVGLEIDPDMVSEVTGHPPESVRADLEAAAGCDLVTRSDRRWEFRHALCRDAVILAVPDDRLGDLQRGAAGVYDARGRPDLAAPLWEAAGDRERAAGCWLAAGREASRHGELASSALWLGRSVELARDPAVRHEALWLLVDVDERLGLAADAVAHGDRLISAIEVAHPRQALETQLRVARTLGAAARWPEAARRIDLVRHRCGNVPDLRAMTALIDAQRSLASSDPNRLGTSARLASEAAALAAEADRADIRCEALETLAISLRPTDLDESTQVLNLMLAEAVRSGSRHLTLRALNELGAAEMLRHADGSRLEEALRQAASAGAVATAAGILVNIAALHAMCGRHSDVMEVASQAEEMLARGGMEPVKAAAIRLRGLARGYTEGSSAMEEEFARADRLAADDPDGAALEWGLGRGMVALINEDTELALDCFERAGSPGSASRVVNPGFGPRLLLRAAAGDATASEVNAAWGQVARGFAWSEAWIHFSEAIVAGRSDAGRARRAMRAGEAAMAPYPLFRALALRRVGEAAVHDRWVDGTKILTELAVRCTDLGLGRVAVACRDLLRAAGTSIPRLRGADHSLPAWQRNIGITTREAEVLTLVGERLGNREIADRLFISHRTVEKHIASLLLKTAATDRASLIRLARTQDGGSAPMWPASG